jgi:hypothetical protein
MRRLLTILALVAGLIAVAAAPAAAVDPPAVGAYSSSGIDVYTAAGDVLHSFAAFQFFSLDGDLFVGSRHAGASESIFGFDATTGAREFRIQDAFAPVALAGGTKVGFMPDRFANRDRFFSSVWLRTASGRERAVVRFAGPHATVNPRDFDGEGTPLGQAWSANGNTLALAFGNDVDLFIYDVWIVDTRTREATRVTRGHVSRFPSLSPSGSRLALLREQRSCGGPAPGYRAGDLLVMDADGTSSSVLLDGGCPLFYTDPEWVSEDELVAHRLTRTAPGVYDVDVVSVDVATGAVTDIATTGDVFSMSASATLGAVAYARADAARFRVLDLASDTTTVFRGQIPHLVGAHRLI